MVDFFIKLFKTFNSSQTPWQMSLAITLGMAIGLTPFSGWQSVIIVLFALVINIHIGLFIVSSGFFAGIAYILDPTFESLGYYILTNSSFQDIFTQFYNLSFMRMTYFNNTLVIGSSIIAFSLLIPMYFILNSLVYIYRDKIAAVLQNYTIFKTLGIEVSDKKDKLLRVWGIGLFIIITAICIVFVLFFLDPLAKKTLQSFISKTTNKNVHIKNVNVSLKNGTLDINDLNIFKNGVSSFNAREISAKIDFNQLLFNRYHIMNLEIKGMEFNQATDAKVKVEKKGTKEHTDSKMTSFNFDTSSIIKPQELISNMELSSSKNYKKALNDFEGIENKYKNAIENDFSKEELENIKSEIDKIKLQLKEIKKIKKLKLTHLELISNSLDDIEKLRKKLKEKRKKLKQLKQEFKEDKKSLINFSNDIIKGANTDYENLSQNYRFNKEGGVNVVGVLFGKSIKEYLSSFLTYYELIKPYLKKEQELASPKRGEGRWIRYKELNSQVDVLVKNIDIDGLYESNKFIANIKNASSNQILLNMPIVLKIKSEGKLSKNIDFGLAKLKSANYIIDAEAKTLDYDTISADAKMNYFKTKFSSEKLKSIKEFYIDIKL
ncbi:MAG: TIGR03546 family protein, partial [Thiovulaceae bacterium]|nr:TIGR03546 family protein [Sulfurimonadaceae bacterium]